MEDVLYEFKKELYEMVTTKELPVEVQLLENLAKRKLKQICENYHILDTNTEQYIDTQFEALKPQMKKIEEAKNEQDFETINVVISQIGLKVEEVSENAKAFDEEKMSDSEFLGKSEQRISSINTKEENSRAIRNAIVVVIDVLEDIRNRINRTAQIDENRKENLNYEISQVKYSIESEMPQALMESFTKNDQKLLQEVSKRFEKYFYIEKNIKANNEKDKQVNPFREELDAGISLKQQSENAKAFMDAQEEHNEGIDMSKALPDDVLK